MSPRRIHFFDMDGTLLPGTTACLQIAAFLDASGALQELEADFAAGRVNTKLFAERVFALWGTPDPAVIRQVFDASPKMQNVEAAVARLHDAGDVACLITMSPDYFANEFLALGFDQVFASRFPQSADEDFDPVTILSPQAKADIARRVCGKHGISLVDCVAYGDSMSDVMLFDVVGLTVAVNSDHHLAERADLYVRGNDWALIEDAVQAHLTSASSH